MYNELLKIGPFVVHGYGLMIAIGVFLALFLAERRAKKKGLDADCLYTLTFLCVIAGFIGAKLLFCLVEFKMLMTEPLRVLSSNGFVVYGGIIGGTLAAFLYIKKKKYDFWKYFDLVLPSVAVAQGFGRIGCFLAGCCYGRTTESWFGIAFQHSNFAPNNVKLIPTQLISAVGMFLIAAVLFVFDRKNTKKGRVGALYLILYSIGRFFVEFLRNDYRGTVGPLSTSQVISIFILLIGIGLFVLLGMQPVEETKMESEKKKEENA